MAVWYGFPVGWVTIIPAKDYLGAVAHGLPVSEFDKAFSHRLIVDLSGLAAEVEFTGTLRTEWRSFGARRDLEHVLKLLRPLIRKNWFAIQAVAEALVLKKTLSGSEVKSLVRLAESVTRLRLRFRT
jgi:hypothetical protein